MNASTFFWSSRCCTSELEGSSVRCNITSQMNKQDRGYVPFSSLLRRKGRRVLSPCRWWNSACGGVGEDKDRQWLKPQYLELEETEKWSHKWWKDTRCVHHGCRACSKPYLSCPSVFGTSICIYMQRHKVISLPAHLAGQDRWHILQKVLQLTLKQLRFNSRGADGWTPFGKLPPSSAIS